MVGHRRCGKKYGARLIDFNSEPFEEVQLEDVKVRISRWALDGGFIIDLPVLKTHTQTKISLGMKNLKGCLALRSKQRFHRHDINRLIALLNTKIRTSLTVIDGIYSLEKGPEFLGTPHRTDVIIAGKDVFSCDIVGAMVMGFQPDEVEYLRQFASLTGRTTSLERIEVKGEPIEKVARKLEWHLSAQDIFRKAGISGITIQDVDTSCCSGCAAILSALTAVLTKDGPNTALDGVEVCIGRKVRARKESQKIFLLGDCSIGVNEDRKDAVSIRGCPPPVMDSVLAMVLKTFPRTKAARILATRTAKQIGTRLGIYHEAFPVFGVCRPPEFDRKHF